MSFKIGISRDLLTAYTDAQALLASGCLDALDRENEARRALAEHLHARLRGASLPGLVRVEAEASPTFWRYPDWTDHPQPLRAFLRARGIDSARTNLTCASREAAFAEFAWKAPHAEAFVDRMVFLPLHPNLSMADMDHVADAVIAYETRTRAPGHAGRAW